MCISHAHGVAMKQLFKKSVHMVLAWIWVFVVKLPPITFHTLNT